MNMKTPTHLLQDSQPTCETSAEAVHKAPLGSVDDVITSLPQPCLQSPQSQPLLNERTNSGSCGTHAHRSVGGSHKSSENNGVSATVCSNCGTTTTPLWRRAPNGETICNACGLYLKARNTVRPPWLKRNAIKKVSTQPAHESTGGSCPGDGHCNGTGGSTTCDGCPAFNQHQVNRQALVCANCRTITTPLWRRDEAGNTICNACGLYYKLHNVHRPITMKRTIIKRRKRVALPTSPQPHHHHHIAPSPSSEDGDLSDHTPGLSHESSGGETGSGTEEEDSVPISRKRKAANEPVRNLKRIDVSSRSVPAIEDYIHPGHGASDIAVIQHQQQAARDIEERRRSLTPVEPATFHSASQVQIHNHPVYHNGAPYQRPLSPVTSEPSAHITTGVSAPYISHAISALLNPTTSSVAQFPSISLPPVGSYPHAGPQVTHYPQAQQTADISAVHTTQQVLATHRQELQREVTNLSVLLTRTAAMLNKLDNAMAAAGQPAQPLGADPLASIMALSNAAASAQYVSPAVSNPGSATMSLPPLSVHHTHHFSHNCPGSPPRAGSCSPKQLPTPPGSNSPTILPLPINYSRA